MSGGVQSESSGSSSSSSSLLRIEEIPGRGRCLVSSEQLKAGQIILKDSPILLYSAFPFTNNNNKSYCQKCFRKIHSSSLPPLSCPSCTAHHFCTPTCLSSALSSSHSPFVCQSLMRLLQEPPCPQFDQERQVQARFLISAYNLALFSMPDFQVLLSLDGRADDDQEVAAAAELLHRIISAVCPGYSLELTAALLAKDKVNAFGLMEFGGIGERSSVRAYGIYPKAAMFNHDCLPNACRFDYVDSEIGGGNNNTDIVVRMIHDVPQGREICLSYFPVNLSYKARQKRLLDDYGFVCDCDRCKVEANWSDHDDDENEVMEEDQDEEMDAVSDGGDEDIVIDNENESEFPHAYFFARYMCDREDCWGMLAPLPPSNGNVSNLLECNVCGNIKNDEFVAC